ncbi:hypothetical protein Pmani_033133 [Petrolisthes manimaculis]|uniref:F5/8 type C domain-containing protein n=1 Tax=Petrolisthes manimaculis TaxID=1843537 RepID=A0AAE1NQC5_9EUCA|nr:hypothetical protein Pmani_033133 [Petrolisthes manimaculis]
MKVLVMVLMVMLDLVRTDLINSNVFMKVVPSMPSHISQCLLEKRSFNLISIRACSVLCSLQTNCLLFCLKGGTCIMYSAQVSSKWPGFSLDPKEITESFDECYSNWFVNSITPSIVAENISASKSYNIYTHPENMINGFYCQRHYFFCFSTSRVNSNRFWRADLGKPKRVSSIIITTRRIYEQFSEVEITLGNSSDYNNIRFDYYEGPSPVATDISFTPTNSVTGRYLHIQSFKNNHFSICDIVILG